VCVKERGYVCVGVNMCAGVLDQVSRNEYRVAKTHRMP